MVSSYPSEPMVYERGFPTPAQATIVTTFTCWFDHASFRKATSSSRPNTSLPVTGNLATETFFGPGLDFGLRAEAHESAEASSAGSDE
jgi:hypothetical protein